MHAASELVITGLSKKLMTAKLLLLSFRLATGKISTNSKRTGLAGPFCFLMVFKDSSNVTFFSFGTFSYPKLTFPI
jgi:hypothetical protein